MRLRVREKHGGFSFSTSASTSALTSTLTSTLTLIPEKHHDMHTFNVPETVFHGYRLGAFVNRNTPWVFFLKIIYSKVLTFFLEYFNLQLEKINIGENYEILSRR